MSAAAIFAPKKPAWLKGSVVAAVALTAIYVWIAWSHPWQPGRFWGAHLRHDCGAPGF